MTTATPAKKRSQPTVPGPVGKVVEKAREVAEGVKEHGTGIGLRTATAAELCERADALNEAETRFQEIRVNYSSRLSPNLKRANAEAAKFIINAKKPISCVLGDAWNESWVEAGFLQHHLRCPKKVVDRIALVDRIAIYLAAHPECEAAAQSITAVRAGEVHHALSSANRAVGHYETERKTSRLARDKAKKALHKMVGDVIIELRRTLPRESTLWSSFGLTAPKPQTRRRKADAGAVSLAG